MCKCFPEIVVSQGAAVSILWEEVSPGSSYIPRTPISLEQIIFNNWKIRSLGLVPDYDLKPNSRYVALHT